MCLLGVDVVNGHVILAHAEAGHLVTHLGTVLVALVHQLLAKGQGVGVVGAAFRDLQRCDGLHIDQGHAALGQVDVVGEQLIGQTGQIGGGTGSGLDMRLEISIEPMVRGLNRVVSSLVLERNSLSSS